MLTCDVCAGALIRVFQMPSLPAHFQRGVLQLDRPLRGLGDRGYPTDGSQVLGGQLVKLGHVEVAHHIDLYVGGLQLRHDGIPHAVQRQRVDILRVGVLEPPARDTHQEFMQLRDEGIPACHPASTRRYPPIGILDLLHVTHTKGWHPGTSCTCHTQQGLCNAALHGTQLVLMAIGMLRRSRVGRGCSSVSTAHQALSRPTGPQAKTQTPLSR